MTEASYLSLLLISVKADSFTLHCKYSSSIYRCNTHTHTHTHARTHTYTRAHAHTHTHPLHPPPGRHGLQTHMAKLVVMWVSIPCLPRCVITWQGVTQCRITCKKSQLEMINAKRAQTVMTETAATYAKCPSSWDARVPTALLLVQSITTAACGNTSHQDTTKNYLPHSYSCVAREAHLDRTERL